METRTAHQQEIRHLGRQDRLVQHLKYLLLCCLVLALLVCETTTASAPGSTPTVSPNLGLGDISYHVGETSVSITNCNQRASGDLIIPAIIEGKPVASIGPNAFNSWRSLTSVSIPNTVTSIGNYAFANCIKLTTVTIPSSVRDIGVGTFSSCSGLTNVTIPNSVNSIGENAFSSCTGLRSVTLGNGVRSIGKHTFYNCRNLSSVTIPSGVKSVEDDAFLSCTSLKSVSIGKNVSKIWNSAFSGCIGLTNIIVDPINSNYASINGVLFTEDLTALLRFPSGIKGAYSIQKSVTSIGDFAFQSTRLTSVTIPNSVTNIGGNAFNSSRSLTRVNFLGNAPSIGYAAFPISNKGFIFRRSIGATGFASGIQGHSVIRDDSL